MILESLVTTVDGCGQVNLAPQGPHVDRELTKVQLQPFVGTRTCKNLRRTQRAVIHVTDDVLLLARAATNTIPPDELTTMVRAIASQPGCYALTDACRWYAVRVRSWQQHPQRPQVDCDIVEQSTQRDFFGWNRGQYAVLETAIMATRLHLIAPEIVRSQLKQFESLVQRAGGEREQEAFSLLQAHIRKNHDASHE